MGQVESTDAIPYDANSWRRLSREYLNALNSQQELTALNYSPSRNISRSRQSLDWNLLTEVNNEKHPQNYRSDVNHLPRAASYSLIDRNIIRDDGTGLVNLNFNETENHRQQQYRQATNNADINNQAGSNIKIERTRSSSPFTHLGRFRTTSSPQFGTRTAKTDKNGAGNGASNRLKDSSRSNESYALHRGAVHADYVDDDYDDGDDGDGEKEFNRLKQIQRSETVNGKTGTAATAKTIAGTGKQYWEDERFESRNNYQNGRNIREQYQTNEPNYERVHHIPYRDIHTSNQRLNQSRTSLNSGWSVNSRPGQYRSQSGEPYFRRRSRQQREKSIGPLKWIFIFMIFLNIASSIWNVVYMWQAGKRIEYGFPLQGKLYVKSNSEIGLYQILLVALLLFSNAVNILAIWATLVNRYWVLWAYVILTFIFGLFGAGSELLRGSYTAWLLPILCGLLAISVTHHAALITF